MSRRIGVCSWSLQPESPADLIGKLQATGLDACQLHLDPLRVEKSGAWKAEHAIDELHDAGIEVRSGMMSMHGEDYSTLESIARTGGVRPDATWKDNLAAAKGNAELARKLRITLVTFHAGFLPHERGAERTKLVARLRELADVFGAAGVRVGFETGQETAETLLEVLAELDRPNVGVNFDPANLILYGMGDPIAALRALGARVFQAHVKDARPTTKKGAWGTEVPVGTGAVDWKGFFAALKAAHVDCDLMIEREAGNERVHDVRTARALLERELGASAGGAR